MSEENTAAPAPSETPRKEIFIRGLNYSTHELTLARHIETVAAVFVICLYYYFFIFFFIFIIFIIIIIFFTITVMK